MEQAFVQHRIERRFKPPRAPHFGPPPPPPPEAMIKAAKRAITHAAGNTTLTDEELLTTSVEAENLLSSRPLTPVSADPDDLQPLTPHHFQVGRIDVPLSVEVCAEEKATPHPRKCWLAVQQVVSQFWKHWQECIPLLNVRKIWHRTERNISTGDIVLVIEDSTPRGQRPMGRIKETFPGADGLVRVVHTVIGQKIK